MHPPAQTKRAARHEANRLERTRSQSAARSFGPDDAVQEFSTIGQLLSCRVCVLDVLHELTVPPLEQYSHGQSVVARGSTRCSTTRPPAVAPAIRILTAAAQQPLSA